METEKSELLKERDEIYTSLFEYYNLLSENLEQNEDTQYRYKLIINEKSQKDILGELNLYIERILKLFWESPKLAANLLLNADLNDVKSYLAHLIINNFYENILSPNDREYHLIYIMTTLLKREINNLNEYCNPDNFLSGSLCSILFDEFYLKDKIQYYSKKVFLDLIEISETEYPSQEFTFNLNQIENTVNFQKVKSKNGKTPAINDCNNQNKINQKKQSNLTKDLLVKKLNQFDSEKNKDMKDYIDINLRFCFEGGKENIYTNYELMNNTKEEYLEIYWNNYYNIKILLDKFIENLSKNLYKLPYSVRCICKIIKILINNKYKSSPSVEQDAFISKFFFGKLLTPFFKDTALLCLINEYIISDSTKKNLLAIKNILSKFFISKFFRSDNKDEKYYTPLNSYFIDKMPEIINLYKEITNVDLPTFVDEILSQEEAEENNIINFDEEEGEDKKDKNEFDFFEKYIDEIIFYRNITFSVDELIVLVNNLEKFNTKLLKDGKNKKIFSLKKSMEKLLSDHNQKLIKDLLHSKDLKIGKVKRKQKKTSSCKEVNVYLLDEKKTNEKPIDGKGKHGSGKDDNKRAKPEKKYFIISDLLFKKEYEKLLSGEKTEKKFFYKKEKKDPTTNEDIEKNNIIKVENLLCTILYYFKEINSIDFDKKKIGDVLSVLRELQKYMNSDFVTFDCVPSEWYLNSLINYIKNLPEEVKQNDLEKIFNELTNDIQTSINEIEFGQLSRFSDAITNMKNYKQYHQKAKEIINDLNLNIQLEQIINTENIPEIPVLQNGCFTLQIKKIKKRPSLFDVIIPGLIQKTKTYKDIHTIQNFINEFPDFSKISDNVFKAIEDFNVPEILSKYFDTVKELIKNKLITADIKELENINNKIYDYVMEKLYVKIFPKEQTDEDKKIYNMSRKIQWIDLKNLSKDSDNYNFEEFLPNCIQYFNGLDREKSPRKKILYMEKIFECIGQLGRFNEKKIEGVDSILPILNYAMIKAKQKRIHSNCEFMDLFLGNKKNGIEGSHLTQLIAASKRIAIFSLKDLNDICESDYLENCRLSELNILY